MTFIHPVCIINDDNKAFNLTAKEEGTRISSTSRSNSITADHLPRHAVSSCPGTSFSPPTSPSRRHHHQEQLQLQHTWRPSLTAPCFTKQNEQEERESLSPEEAKYLQSEITGIDDTFIFDYEATHDIEHCVKEVEQYIASDTISAMQKKEYLQALDKCPNLVENETNPIMFLRSENYNIEVRSINTLCQSLIEWISLFLSVSLKHISRLFLVLFSP